MQLKQQRGRIHDKRVESLPNWEGASQRWLFLGIFAETAMSIVTCWQAFFQSSQAIKPRKQAAWALTQMMIPDHRPRRYRYLIEVNAVENQPPLGEQCFLYLTFENLLSWLRWSPWWARGLYPALFLGSRRLQEAQCSLRPLPKVLGLRKMFRGYFWPLQS